MDYPPAGLPQCLHTPGGSAVPASDLGGMVELDLSPVICHEPGEGCVAVDGQIRLALG